MEKIRILDVGVNSIRVRGPVVVSVGDEHIDEILRLKFPPDPSRNRILDVTIAEREDMD